MSMVDWALQEIYKTPFDIQKDCDVYKAIETISKVFINKFHMEDISKDACITKYAVSFTIQFAALRTAVENLFEEDITKRTLFQFLDVLEEKIKKEVNDLKKEGTVESIHKSEGTNLTELLDSIINDANMARELIGGNVSFNTTSKPKTNWHKTSVELPPRRSINCNLSIDVLDPCGDKCHYHYGVRKWIPSRGCGEYPSPPPYWTELPIFNKENC